MNWADIRDFLVRHRSVLLGVGIGLLIGILMLTIGFWRTLLLTVCVGVGALVGYLIGYRKERLLALLERILPGGLK